jgi:hypothetical protein
MTNDNNPGSGKSRPDRTAAPRDPREQEDYGSRNQNDRNRTPQDGGVTSPHGAPIAPPSDSDRQRPPEPAAATPDREDRGPRRRVDVERD